jgi:hypothetical protein
MKPSLTMIGLNQTKERVVALETQIKSKKALKTVPQQVEQLCGQLEAAIKELTIS